jgi:hypothetical protein
LYWTMALGHENLDDITLDFWTSTWTWTPRLGTSRHWLEGMNIVEGHHDGLAWKVLNV